MSLVETLNLTKRVNFIN